MNNGSHVALWLTASISFRLCSFLSSTKGTTSASLLLKSYSSMLRLLVNEQNKFKLFQHDRDLDIDELNSRLESLAQQRLMK